MTPGGDNYLTWRDNVAVDAFPLCDCAKSSFLLSGLFLQNTLSTQEVIATILTPRIFFGAFNHTKWLKVNYILDLMYFTSITFREILVFNKYNFRKKLELKIVDIKV